jgi:hypothetical protein
MRTLILFAFLAGCEFPEQFTSTNATDGVALSKALKEDCPNGGVVINQGVDANHNGKIDPSEVTGSDTLCHGRDGKDGDNGKNGLCQTTKVTMSITCQALLAGTNVTAVYNANVLSSGDLFVSATVHGFGFATGASLMYAATQINADTTPVAFVYDLAGPSNKGHWKLSFNRETMIVSVEYTDVDVANGKLTWQLTTSDCTVGDY